MIFLRNISIFEFYAGMRTKFTDFISFFRAWAEEIGVAVTRFWRRCNLGLERSRLGLLFQGQMGPPSIQPLLLFWMLVLDLYRLLIHFLLCCWVLWQWLILVECPSSLRRVFAYLYSAWLDRKRVPLADQPRFHKLPRHVCGSNDRGRGGVRFEQE